MYPLSTLVLCLPPVLFSYFYPSQSTHTFFLRIQGKDSDIWTLRFKNIIWNTARRNYLIWHSNIYNYPLTKISSPWFLHGDFINQLVPYLENHHRKKSAQDRPSWHLLSQHDYKYCLFLLSQTHSVQFAANLSSKLVQSPYLTYILYSSKPD